MRPDGIDATPPEPGEVVAAMRAELVTARAALQRAEDWLGALERQQSPPRALRDRPERYLRVLVDVYERGGRHGVDGDTFARIGSEYGYDPRGLGGFFAGSRPSLRRGDGRVTLTAAGEQLVDAFLRQLSR